MHPPQIFIYALRAHFLRSRAFIRWFRLSDSLANYSPVAEINAVFHDWTWADFLLLYSFLNEGKGEGKIYNFFREEYSKERKRCCCGGGWEEICFKTRKTTIGMEQPGILAIVYTAQWADLRGR